MITISQATSKDIPIIQEIAHKTWPITYDSILFKAQLDYMTDLIKRIPRSSASGFDGKYNYYLCFYERTHS